MLRLWKRWGSVPHVPNRSAARAAILAAYLDAASGTLWLVLPNFRPVGERTVKPRSNRYHTPRTVIPAALRPVPPPLATEVGLRQAGKQLGLSHEGVRGICRRVAEGTAQAA